jgi:hypothetical protein
LGARVSLFVWVFYFDPSGKGATTSSYATAGIALRIIITRKPPYPAIMPSSKWRYLKEDRFEFIERIVAH